MIKKFAIAAALLVIAAPVSEAAWGKRARHRDDLAIRVLNGEYNSGWHHTRDVHAAPPQPVR